MRPPSTYWLRKFNERCKSAANSGRQVVDNEEIRNVTTELLDVLCYVTELENRIDILEQKTKEMEILTVEIVGDNF